MGQAISTSPRAEVRSLEVVEWVDFRSGDSLLEEISLRLSAEGQPSQDQVPVIDFHMLSDFHFAVPTEETSKDHFIYRYRTWFRQLGKTEAEASGGDLELVTTKDRTLKSVNFGSFKSPSLFYSELAGAFKKWLEEQIGKRLDSSNPALWPRPQPVIEKPPAPKPVVQAPISKPEPPSPKPPAAETKPKLVPPPPAPKPVVRAPIIPKPPVPSATPKPAPPAAAPRKERQTIGQIAMKILTRLRRALQGKKIQSLVALEEFLKKEFQEADTNLQELQKAGGAAAPNLLVEIDFLRSRLTTLEKKKPAEMPSPETPALPPQKPQKPPQKKGSLDILFIRLNAAMSAQRPDEVNRILKSLIPKWNKRNRSFANIDHQRDIENAIRLFGNPLEGGRGETRAEVREELNQVAERIVPAVLKGQTPPRSEVRKLQKILIGEEWGRVEKAILQASEAYAAPVSQVPLNVRSLIEHMKEKVLPVNHKMALALDARLIPESETEQSNLLRKGLTEGYFVLGYRVGEGTSAETVRKNQLEQKIRGLKAEVRSHFRLHSYVGEGPRYEELQGKLGREADRDRMITLWADGSLRMPQEGKGRDLTFVIDPEVLASLKLSEIISILQVVASAPPELKNFYLNSMNLTPKSDGLSYLNRDFVNALATLEEFASAA